MLPRSAIFACLLAACGTLDPVDRQAPVASHPGTVAPSPTDSPAELPSFVTPPGFDPLFETWKVDLRDIDILPARTWETLHRDLAVVILRDDEPTLDVRVGSLVPDTDPPLQDWCTPASTRIEGAVDEDGLYEVLLPGEHVQLGQPWDFDAVWISGVRNGGESTMDLTASIPALDLGLAAFDEDVDACERLALYDLSCTPCLQKASLADELCVKVPLSGTVAARVDGLDLEPITAGDVAANPACD